MSSDGFQSTSLWKRTLAPFAGDERAADRERLRIANLRLRESVGVLLGELGASMSSYTVHDLTHADALWETASMVTGDDILINPAEAFVLGAAFLFHDAAMGLAAYPHGLEQDLGEDRWRDLVCSTFRDRIGRWPLDHEVDDPPKEVASAAASAAIRDSHATQAAALIRQPLRTPAGEAYYLFDDAMLRDWYGRTIGMLAESHWWSVETLPTRFRHRLNPPPQLHGWTVDPLTLACVLRLADATQVDARRAPTMLLALRRPDADSLKHWQFQRFVGAPRLDGDRVTYTSARPFDRTEAAAWWLALDYLRDVDEELRRVDGLLHDLRRPRFVARGVAGVGAPERFAELFETTGWRPLDADVHISDVRSLVTALGGEQLYGRQPEIAVRELIQNAQDAVVARLHLEPDVDGVVEVALEETQEGWTLAVQDNGLGMDEDILVRGLMDFGSSGWRRGMVRRKFPGLIGSGFRPKGTFGIGFFSVFMLGDRVEVVSRRYDLGRDESRRLVFDGLASRPLVTPLAQVERSYPGTRVSVRLSKHPYDKDGLLSEVEGRRLSTLVRRLVVECQVPVRIRDQGVGGSEEVLQPFSLATASAPAVFDRLYPPETDNDAIERLRLEFGSQFVLRATEIIDNDGVRVGLALLDRTFSVHSRPDLRGLTVVDGFAADRLTSFSGYVLGRPSRASREGVEVVADDAAISRWVASQEQRHRKLGLLTAGRQFEFGTVMLRVGLPLSDDHRCGFIGDSRFTVGEIAAAMGHRDRLVLSWGWPLAWHYGADERGVRVFHYPSGNTVRLPDGWVIVIGGPGLDPTLEAPLASRRDPAYESARFHRRSTWQRFWWRSSDDVDGFFFARLAEVWGCSIEDLLAPVAARNWSDTADIDVPGVGTVEAHVLRLERPRSV